jgi:hypothetical protein
MKRIISLVSVGVLSLALAAPVLADNQHDGKVRGPHARPARFQHFRSFRGPFIQPYYYPYPSYVYYPYPVYYPEAVAQESPWVDPAPEVQREVVFSTGKYVLQSDGGDLYRWVWIPAVPEAPPMAASPAVSPVPSAPIVVDPVPSGPPQRIYHWTDEHGVANWTNNAEAVPAKYRSPANRDRPS